VLTSVNADAAPPDELRRSGASHFVPKVELANCALADLLA
jgi:hypothetical protein